ncbi:MAG: diacylglycerol kinase family lipid kinase [Armatimonadetes bacterium]|nr:diacylglycerol kinase family lipid kinase [Armatimonadota bacterium]
MEAWLILNPSAGIGRAHLSPEAISALLAEHGIAHARHLTTGPGEATELARAAARAGAPVAIAAGGDGTVHEVLNGLVGSGTALGILPLGTENICARALGIPFEVRSACEHLAKAKCRAVDVGRVGDRFFLSMAGLGFDAYVVSRVRGALKERLHSLAFFLTGMRALTAYRTARVRLETDGEVWEGDAWGVLVCNAPLYAWRVRVAPDARVDDGWLDVCVFDQRSRGGFLAAVLASAAFGRMVCRVLRTRRVRIETPKPLPAQLDGELVSLESLEFAVVPGGLRVAGAATELEPRRRPRA